jgi:hypothetical protein
VTRTIDFNIELGDITTFGADVVALKYAQEFYGADEAVASLLSSRGIDLNDLCPRVGEHLFASTRQAIPSPSVLFVGVKPLGDFRYQEIKQFAASVIRILSQERPAANHVAITLHGPGYGLDETEALFSEVAGLVESLQDVAVMGRSNLSRISLVERSPGRVQRLKEAFEQNEHKFIEHPQQRWPYPLMVGRGAMQALEASRSEECGSVEIQSEQKPHVFVAMPFAKNLEDVFHYGIQRPVHEAGFLCERVDQEAFTGDILTRIKQRIETSAVVIAELSDANPNVYLEIGYAWGKDRPTILLTKEAANLRFDIQGQRCLVSEGIIKLEELLTKELLSLKSNRII